MNKIFENKFYWITGTAVALSGVAAVRLVAPELSGMSHKTLMCVGYFLSLAGIIIIAAASIDRKGKRKTD